MGGLIARRGMMVKQGGGLPAGYTQYDWLLFNGQQRIDTGVAFSGRPRHVEIDIMREATATVETYIGALGPRDDSFQINKLSANTFRYQFNHTGNTWVNINNSSLRLKLVLEESKCFAGNVEASINTISLNHTIEITIGCRGGDYLRQARFKLYGCKIDLGQDRRDYVPCTDRNGIPCLFDMVTRRTFYNAGTGDFEYGNDN